MLPIKTSEMNFKAPRPKYSVLDLERLRNEFDFDLRSWEDALKDMLSNL